MGDLQEDEGKLGLVATRDPSIKELITDQLIDQISVGRANSVDWPDWPGIYWPHSPSDGGHYVIVRLDKEGVQAVPPEIWSLGLDDVEFQAKLIKLEWRDDYLVDLTYWISEERP
jgi:hypothetical protein